MLNRNKVATYFDYGVGAAGLARDAVGTAGLRVGLRVRVVNVADRFPELEGETGRIIGRR